MSRGGEGEELVRSEIRPDEERSSRWRISFAVPPLIRRGRTGHAAASHHRKNQEGGDDSALGEPPVKRRRSDFTLLVDHVRSSSVAECGTQVWGAALLLADLLVNVAHELQGMCVVELGAGIGVPGMALAKAAGGSVFLTDYSDEVLQRCMRNVGENDLDDGPGCRGRDHGEAEPGGGGCRVRKLDWADPRFPGRDEANRFGWTEEDLAILSSCQLIFASDVAYAHGITESFVAFSQWFLGQAPCRQMVLAVERRVCFTAPELTETSREHDFLLSLLGVQGREGKTSEGLNSGERRLLCERLRVDFEQRVAYDRHPNLQLWRVWLDDGATVHPPTWMSKLSPM